MDFVRSVIALFEWPVGAKQGEMVMERILQVVGVDKIRVVHPIWRQIKRPKMGKLKVDNAPEIR